MRKSLPVAVLAAAILVSGCAHRRMSNGGPDEFAVARQAPLVVPPDYALVPPQPGAAAVQANSATQQTLDALFGGPAPRSTTETAVINGAGYDNGDIGVRSNAGDPKTNVVDKGATTRDIVAAPQGDGQDARAQAGK